MQMTMELNQRPAFLSAFALRRGRGYMMRSEKRPGYNGSGNGNRPPRKKKAGPLYIVLTLLLSLILWPVGMVLLWRRKVRMQPGTKLLLSLVTLCASVFLIVFALTVDVPNARFTAFQDSANDFLDRTAEELAVAGDAAVKKSGETWTLMTEFADASSPVVLDKAADGLSWTVDKAVLLRDKALILMGKEPPVSKPVPTATPTAEATEAVSDTPVASATPERTAVASDTPRPADSETPEASQAPETPEPNENSSINLRVPAAMPDPETAQPLGEGTVHADGTFDAGVTP